MEKARFISALGTCRNCKHWRDKAWTDKAWTDKGWGVCDNSKNDVKSNFQHHLHGYVTEDLIKTLEELDTIRYPEDFGCIYFESKQ